MSSFIAKRHWDKCCKSDKFYMLMHKFNALSHICCNTLHPVQAFDIIWLIQIAYFLMQGLKWCLRIKRCFSIYFFIHSLVIKFCGLSHHLYDFLPFEHKANPKTANSVKPITCTSVVIVGASIP